MKNIKNQRISMLISRLVGTLQDNLSKNGPHLASPLA